MLPSSTDSVRNGRNGPLMLLSVWLSVRVHRTKPTEGWAEMSSRPCWIFHLETGDREFAVFVWVSYLSPNTRRSPRCINTQAGDGRANCLQCPFPGQVREIRELFFFSQWFSVETVTVCCWDSARIKIHHFEGQVWDLFSFCSWLVGNHSLIVCQRKLP